MQTNARIFVAGHAGLAGSALMRRVRKEGFTRTLSVPRAELDLRDPAKLLDVTKLHNRGWHHQIDLREAIGNSYDWFLMHRSKARRLPATCLTA